MDNKSVKRLIVFFVTALFSSVHCCTIHKNGNIECSSDVILEQKSLTPSKDFRAKSLMIYGPNLSTIAPNTFEKLQNIKKLNLLSANNKVLNLQPESFNGLSNLTTLRIQSGIVALKKNLFRSISKTRVLELRINGSNPILSNGLSILGQLRQLKIRNTIFNELNDQTFLKISTNIRKLELRRNSLTIIKPGAFSPLKNLRQLKITKNNLVRLSGNIFSQLPNIHHIYLPNNSISSMESDVFRNLKMTGTLDLSFNNLTRIEENCFKNFTAADLYIFANDINFVHPDAFTGCKIIEVFLSNATATAIKEVKKLIPAERYDI